MENKKYPRVGIGVVVKKENTVLLGLRKGSHGAGLWGIPGGHQEFGETMEACAKRELKKETGLEAKKFELISIADEMNYIDTDGKHYVSIGFLADYVSGNPRLIEPKKCQKWKWFSLDALPKNLHQGSECALKKLFQKI